jgi:hypothetical protein
VKEETDGTRPLETIDGIETFRLEFAVDECTSDTSKELISLTMALKRKIGRDRSTTWRGKRTWWACRSWPDDLPMPSLPHRRQRHRGVREKWKQSAFGDRHPVEVQVR